jgi:hypothetical protein
MEPQTMEVKSLKDYFTLGMFELAGTCILTIAYNFGYSIDFKKTPPDYKTRQDVVAAGLFVAILLTKRVTGSHLNAGITLAVSIVEKVD